MKKAVTLFLTSCLALSLVPFWANPQVDAAPHAIVDVKLQNFLGNRSQIPFKVIGAHKVAGSEFTFTENTDYVLKLENGLIKAYKGTTLVANLGTEFTLFPFKYGETSLIYINGKAYLGNMRFIIENGAYIRPINSLPMDDYLKGVVSYEMSNSWGNNGGLEALKAQAVAARTFALRYGTSTITDTQSHQVYGGYSWYTHTNRAVNETSGTVARHAGKLIEAFYSSSNGGRIFSNKNSWGSTLVPYLLLKEDPYDIRSGNANVNWSFSLAKKQIDLSGLDKENPYTWWDSVGEKSEDLTEISNAKRYLQNYGYVSSKYEMKITEINNVSFDTVYDSNQRVDGQISIKYILRDKTLSQIGNSPFVMELGTIKEHSLVVDERSYNVRSMFGSTIMKSPYVKNVQDNGDTFTILGGGWGHNIGMSQYGAYQMSKEGKNYKEILQFYYNNISVSDEMAPFVANIKASADNQNQITLSFSSDEGASLSVKLINEASKIETGIAQNKDVLKGDNTFTFDATALPGGNYSLKVDVMDGSGNITNLFIPVPLQDLVKVEEITGMLHIPDSASIYNDHDYESGKASSISSQDVIYTQKFGDWYRITTWLGHKWIHKSNVTPINFVSQNYSIFLTERVVLHDLPHHSKQIDSVVSPQNVKVTSQWNDWMRIETWLGPKWIKYTEIPVEPFENQITIMTKSALYDYPTELSATHGVVSPQTVTALKKQGGWIQIATYIGPKWVKEANTSTEVFQFLEKNITLTSRATLYAKPDVASATYGGVAPQIVYATKKTDNWIEISTYLGLKWIQLEHVIEDVPLKVENYIQVSQVSYLYSEPNVSTQTNMHIAPQQVYAIEKLGHWYKVKTWAGTYWILSK